METMTTSETFGSFIGIVVLPTFGLLLFMRIIRGKSYQEVLRFHERKKLCLELHQEWLELRRVLERNENDLDDFQWFVDDWLFGWNDLIRTAVSTKSLEELEDARAQVKVLKEARRVLQDLFDNARRRRELIVEQEVLMDVLEQMKRDTERLEGQKQLTSGAA